MAKKKSTYKLKIYIDNITQEDAVKLFQNILLEAAEKGYVSFGTCKKVK